MTNYKDINELREELKDYYGTAATVIGNGNSLDFLPAFGEMINVDNLDDEEVIEKAEELGIL